VSASLRFSLRTTAASQTMNFMNLVPAVHEIHGLTPRESQAKASSEIPSLFAFACVFLKVRPRIS